MFKKCAWKYQRLHFLDLAIASLLSKQSSQLIAFLTDFSSGKWTRNADKLQNVSFFPPSSLPGCVSAGCVLSVLGQMVRGRSVVLRAAGEGRPCPEQLTQHRSCPVKPCYSWQLGPWSPCTVQVGISPELPPARGQRQNPSSVCGINCWSWARGVSVAGGGLQGRGGSSGVVNPCPSTSNQQQPFMRGDMGWSTVSSWNYCRGFMDWMCLTGHSHGDL